MAETWLRFGGVSKTLWCLSTTIIEKLRQTFATMGLSKIVSDDGTVFISSEFDYHSS